MIQFVQISPTKASQTNNVNPNVHQNILRMRINSVRTALLYAKNAHLKQIVNRVIWCLDLHLSLTYSINNYAMRFALIRLHSIHQENVSSVRDSYVNNV